MKSHKSTIHEAGPSAGRPGRSRFSTRAAAAFTAAFALALGGASGAQAAVGDSAEAEGQWISGSLLDSLATEDLVSLGEVSATNDGLSPDDEQEGDLDVDLLDGLVSIDVGGGLQLPVNFIAFELGVIDQCAFAGSDATAIGAAGLISDDGAIEEIDDTVDPPTMATLDLTNLLGDEFADAITGLTINTGAVSATAQVDEGGVPYGDYQLAGADLTLDSPLLAEITDALGETLVDLGPTVDAAVGSSGLVDAVLTDLTDLITALLPGTSVDGTAAIDVGLTAIVDDLIASPLASSSGATTIDFSTGTITVTLQDLRSLNGLPPNTDILDDVALGLVVGEVGNIIDGLLTDVVESVTTALEAAAVTLDGTVELAGAPAASLTITDTLAALATGESTGDAIETDVPLLDIGAVLADVLPLLQDAASDLLDTIDGTLVTLGATVDTVTEPLLTELSGLIELVDEVVQLTANVQDPEPALQDVALEVIGLQVNLLDTELSAIPTALELNLARGLVLASAGDPVSDLALDPDEGPLEGGNEVTIDGTDLGDDPTVIVDGTPVDDTDVTVNPDGTITIVMPPGTVPGPVDVSVDNGNGPSEPAAYFYVADTSGDDDAPVITDVTPDSGPTDGGTTVVIEGDNFDIVTEVTIDGEPVDWQLQDDGSITFTTPPHAAGIAEIILSSEAGDAVGYFTYTADTGPGGPGGGPGTGPGTGAPGGLPVTGGTIPTAMVVFALLLLATGGGLTLNAMRKRRSLI